MKAKQKRASSSVMCLLPIIIMISGLGLLVGCSQQETYAPVIDGWRQPVTKQGVHQVQGGETLYSIAWNYGFDYRELARINHIAAPYTLQVGQKISLVTQPGSQRLAAAAKPAAKSAAKPAAVAAAKPASKASKNSIASSKVKPVKPSQAATTGAVKQWNWPAKGQIIGHFTQSSQSLGNKGIDIAGKPGTPVLTTAAGEVVYSGAGLVGYGNLIIIKHNENYLSAYAHNRKNLVKEGQQVKSQQKIAEMGDTGAKRTMLHFEIRHNGKPVDPEKFLSKKQMVG